MFRRRSSDRAAARLSAAIYSSTRSIVEPLESRRLLSAGILDPRFGGTGTVTDRSTSAPNYGGGLIIQSSGKTVTLSEDAAGHVVLTRYNVDGSVDATFGSGGKVVTSFFDVEPADIALAANDGIVIGTGQTLARFTANGATDTTFGAPNGWVGTDATIRAIAVDASNGVVVAEDKVVANNHAPEFQHFAPAGSLDVTFGSGGSAVYPGTVDSAVVHDMIIESDGDILAVGEDTTSTTTSPYVLQLNPNGTLPSPFYGFNVPNGAKSSYFNGVAQAPDGSVVAAGQSWDGNDNSGLLVKFTVGGPNTGQTQFVDYLNTGSAGAGIFDRVAVQPDGKIVAAGSANPIFRSLWVVRTNADGTADTTFGNGGATFVNTNAYIYTVDGIALTPDSAPRIVANVFQMGGNLTPPSNAFQVVALTSDTSPTDQPYPTGSSAPTAIGVHQAENFDLGGEGVAYHDTEPQNLGGQYRPNEGVDIEALPGGAGYDVGWIHSGEFLNYLINSPTDAQYDLAVRVANYGSGGSFQIYVDGNLASIRNNFTPVYEPIPIPDTGSFTNYTDVKVGALSLSAGTHQIRIVFTGNSQYGFSGNVDSFTLAPHSVGGQPYTGTPFATGQRVEAENFDLGGEGVAYHDTEAQNLGGQYRPNEGVDLESTTDIGGGYDVGWAHAGEWLQYTGNFPTTGHYDFSARVANYGANGSIVVTVDGEYLTGIMAIPDTGGFQSWATIGLTNLTIPAGVHVVRIAFYGQSSFGFSGNLNWFEFAPTPTIQEVPWGNTPAPVPGTIQAENYDYGGEGLGYHDTDPQNLGGAYRNDGVDIESFANGQFAVDYAHAGEWMNYTVNIANSGDYTFSALVSDYGVGGQFHLELDGTPITNSLLVPNTGSFTSFSKVSAPLIHLISGRHVIRWVWDANTQYGFAGNVDSFSFT